MSKKAIWGVVGILFMAAAAMQINVTAAYASKVDCAKVMSEVTAGKKAKDIATDLKISTSSVYRCKKKAAGATSTAKLAKSPGATASPAASK